MLRGGAGRGGGARAAPDVGRSHVTHAARRRGDARPRVEPRAACARLGVGVGRRRRRRRGLSVLGFACEGSGVRVRVSERAVFSLLLAPDDLGVGIFLDLGVHVVEGKG